MIMKKVQKFLADGAKSVKGIAKILLQSRRCGVSAVADAADVPLAILGNGPSLADVIAHDMPSLRKARLMAVNFAANAPEFLELRPDYYILADPLFFGSERHDNVEQLWQRLSLAVDWPMTLFVPLRHAGKARSLVGGSVKVEGFNDIGVEGYRWLRRMAYDSGRAMPRPRNVLIPAIMVGIKMGYRSIYIYGADHSWIKTLDVNERNEVVSIQPHFYKDDNKELSRVATVYKDIRLHELMLSFHIAFKSYWDIADYARCCGVNIYNATRGSFIDAFPRRQL